VPPLSHLTSCIHTTSNIYIANSLAAAVSELALSRLLTLHVPNLMSLFRCSVHTKVSIQAQDMCSCFVTKPVFKVRGCQQLSRHPSWRTTPCLLSATVYTIYSQLPSVLEAVPPSAIWGQVTLWWQGPNYPSHSPIYPHEMHKDDFTFHSDSQRK